MQPPFKMMSVLFLALNCGPNTSTLLQRENASITPIIFGASPSKNFNGMPDHNMHGKNYLLASAKIYVAFPTFLGKKFVF